MRTELCISVALQHRRISWQAHFSDEENLQTGYYWWGCSCPPPCHEATGPTRVACTVQRTADVRRRFQWRTLYSVDSWRVVDSETSQQASRESPLLPTRAATSWTCPGSPTQTLAANTPAIHENDSRDIIVSIRHLTLNSVATCKTWMLQKSCRTSVRWTVVGDRP